MPVVRNKFITLDEVEVDGEAAYVIRDGDGYVMDKAEFAEVLNQLNLVYDIEDQEFNEMITEENRTVFFGNLGTSEDDIYTVMNGLVYDTKKFNPKRKREVKYTCDLCNGDIDSKEMEHYYRIPNIRGLTSERACSESCIKIIWKEWVNTKLKEKGFRTI